MRSTPIAFLLALAVGMCTLAAPASADATCLIQCKGALMGEQCAEVSTVKQGDPIWFWVSCETCCSPPGGPLNCNKADPYTFSYKLIEASGGATKGKVTPSAIGCPGKEGVALAFIPEGGVPLAPGKYQLVQGGMILVAFEVLAGSTPDAGGSDAGAADAGSGADSGTVADAGSAADTGSAADAGSAADSGTAADTGSDTGTVADAGSAADTGSGADTAMDAGGPPDVTTPPDAGTNQDVAGSDAGGQADDAESDPPQDVAADVGGAQDSGGTTTGAQGDADSGGCSAGPTSPAQSPWPFVGALALLFMLHSRRRARASGEASF